MIVIDASIIVKLAKKEEGTNQAIALKEKHIKGEERIVVPPLLFYEVANALLYAKELKDKEISDFLEILSELDFEIIELSIKDIIKATILGRKRGITVYDTSYLILAEKLGVDFITADLDLFKKVKDLNFVKLLSRDKLKLYDKSY
ncbi:VapC toxin family PIN domain ribonuclease [bacterium (Candidatus Gribaldobacteria) CG_4_10_14_0_2_um_filter_36_18]|uniref:Ribonuclease VapC n=1 Tax=bacterium (Candidatus Gribaldobacteria) CG_4_10_14_0_2_um_filter_36_18 TaxID=2014264 RepID=A0A2M7VJI8_9BACT|nr:MAG: VapC toxin family PIN domain ribonuclease [bacterium (Candidatus Gribaldobacteria) CG_4_10_14_0_2_um_filter_36_18]